MTHSTSKDLLYRSLGGHFYRYVHYVNLRYEIQDRGFVNCIADLGAAIHYKTVGYQESFFTPIEVAKKQELSTKVCFPLWLLHS